MHIAPFFLYFGFGALAFLHKDRLPMSWMAFLGVITALVYAPKGGFTNEIFVFLLGYVLLFLGLNPQLNLSRLTKSGDYSYGLYIWAWPVQQSVEHFLGHGNSVWIYLGISFSVSMLLAILSWHLIEKRMLRLKRRASTLV